MTNNTSDIIKNLANMMKKPLGYKNLNDLRDLINKDIQSNIKNKSTKIM